MAKRKTHYQRVIERGLSLAVMTTDEMRELLKPHENDLADDRPAAKQKVHPALWQSYIWWWDLMSMRKRAYGRLSAILGGKSTMDPLWEIAMLNLIGNREEVATGRKSKKTSMDYLIETARARMIMEGEKVGDIWYWLTDIRGLGTGHLAAQLLAHFDDIRKPPNPSAMCRFAGYGVVDGKAERNRKGEPSHYNSKLKGLCYVIGDVFLKHRSQPYRGVYDEYKARQQAEHPRPICGTCGAFAVTRLEKKSGKDVVVWRCPDDGSHRSIKFTPQHIHLRSMRKMIKVFLTHLWITWREYEGLPTGGPYVQDIMGHLDIVPPPVKTAVPTP